MDIHLTPLDTVAVAPIVAGVVVIAARRSGLTWRELGLAPSSWRATRVASAGLVGVAVVAVSVAVAVPGLRENIMSTRFTSVSGAVAAAFVVIPLVTVIPEELLFRGVLDASLRRVLGVRMSLALGAVVFGLWHALAWASLTAESPALASRLGTGLLGQSAGVAGAVVVTTIAGLGFGWLRIRTGSVVTPIVAHWVLNGSGAIASALAWRLAQG